MDFHIKLRLQSVLNSLYSRSPDLSNCDANQAPVPSDVGEKPNPDSVPQFQMSDIGNSM